MDINEQYIKNIRMIDKELKRGDYNDIKKQMIESYKEILVLSYGDDITNTCNHSICNNDGYYKIKGKEIYVATKKDAEFRQVVCEQCGEAIYLVNTGHFNWDSKLGREVIQVKQFVKKRKK